MISLKRKLTKWPANISINLDGEMLDVKIRAHKRSKHYRLSILAGARPVLSVPAYGKLEKAEKFLTRHSAWLETRLKHEPKIIAFIDGAMIPFKGVEHRLIMASQLRGLVKIIETDTGMAFEVPGGENHMARRLEDWLKKQARIDLEAQVKIHAKNLAVTPISISIRSQSSRWGSCSSSGRLNFNWRLILAPPFVLDYVAAHEVAHLLEMNHSAAFWKTVEKTLPDMERGRNWLKANGQILMAYNI